MRAGERLDAPYAKKGKSYTPYTGTLVVRRGGGGMRKERESARSRARGDEKAWIERDRDDSFVAAVYHRWGDKQLTFVRSSLLSPGLSRFLQSKTPSFRPSYLGRKQAVLAILSLLLLSGCSVD